MFSISGHEDALDDFGIYEFVAFPDASGVPRVGFPIGWLALWQMAALPSAVFIHSVMNDIAGSGDLKHLSQPLSIRLTQTRKLH